jgi:hypothetical protein
LALGNPTKQHDALETVAKNWLKPNDQQARQTIQNSGLAPELTQELLRGR